MRIIPSRTSAALTLALLATCLSAAEAAAQTPSPQPPAGRPAVPAPSAGGAWLGFDVFGGAAVTWPVAKDSFEATGLDSKPLEYGGGARVTNLWRDLFAGVSVSRWSDTGERAFVDSTGERFPLGIPLDVEATFVDATIGWKSPFTTARGTVAAWSYVGGGAGMAMYSESSPFAEPGDDVDENKVSYHVLGGVEVPILRWLAVGIEARYRWVPDLLGAGGISEALGEDTLGGFGMAFGARIGFGASTRPPVRRGPAAGPAKGEPQLPPIKPPAGLQVEAGVILTEAPVYLLPDTTRTPLRTLPPGTAVRIMEETKEWFRIQFTDPQFGPRFGYVLRKFVQIGKSDVP